MEQLEHLSFKGQKALFNRLEELARIANMNKKERAEYEVALKIYRDNENVMDYAVQYFGKFLPKDYCQSRLGLANF